MEPSRFGAVRLSRKESTFAVCGPIGSEVFILHSKVFPQTHIHECRPHPCNGPAFMGGRCCVTQHPIAPQLRDRHGKNQHSPSAALSAVRFSSCTARFSLRHTYMNADPIRAMALPSWEADVVRHNTPSRRGRD